MIQQLVERKKVETIVAGVEKMLADNWIAKPTDDLAKTAELIRLILSDSDTPQVPMADDLATLRSDAFELLRENPVSGFPAELGDYPTEMERWLHAALNYGRGQLALGPPRNTTLRLSIRDHCIDNYGYAIITQQLVEGIREFVRENGITLLVGIGSGTGYLERELRRRMPEVGIISSDPNRRKGADYSWTHREALEFIGDNPNAGLLLSWPEFDSKEDWPAETVKEYKGRFVFYFGEGDNAAPAPRRCTGFSTRTTTSLSTKLLSLAFTAFETTFSYTSERKLRKSKPCFT